MENKNIYHDNIFLRTEMLIGKVNLEKLKNSHIAIFGIGGVGGYAFEALVRCGIGKFDLFDNDVIDITNINRQIIADINTIGLNKVDVAKSRGVAINPNVKINVYKEFVLPETVNKYDFSSYDYIIDAIDTVSGKIAIIEKAVNENINIISSMGTGSKLNPMDLKVTDIYKTRNCPLAKVMRNELKKRSIKKLQVCYSEEEVKPCMIENPPLKVNGRPTPSSISFVPSCAGLIIASEVVKNIINKG